MKLNRSSTLVIAVALCVAGAVAAWRLLAVREAAPTVSYTLLDGSSSSVGAQRGKVLLLSFWATRCGRIAKRYVGAPDFAALDQRIGELLAER